ncbi:MAG: LytTR family DNA-binding domain-containing protein [Paludibacter sp.]|jgi:two-component system LytT family response regulator|nr:LytTR family DNA-binding domain-containing protein [Paludibacter sp.]
MRILIVDDEAPARDYHRRLLQLHFPELENCGEAASVDEAYQQILLFNPDLLLLDIDMPDGTAFDLLRRLKEIRFSIIFISAHEKYALQAIKFSALDYLLKPFMEAEFVESIRKAVHRSDAAFHTLQLTTLMQNLRQDPLAARVILRTSDAIHVVEMADIIRLQADGAYTRFFVKNRNPLLVSRNLKEYETMLSQSGFLRTHQSHLVNLRHVSCYHKADGGALSLSDGERVPVATRYKEKVVLAISRI